MNARMHASTHARMHARTHTRMYACTNTHACTHACTHTHTHAHTHVRTHAARAHTCTHKHTHVRMHKHDTCMYTHTHITRNGAHVQRKEVKKPRYDTRRRAFNSLALFSITLFLNGFSHAYSFTTCRDDPATASCE